MKTKHAHVCTLTTTQCICTVFVECLDDESQIHFYLSFVVHFSHYCFPQQMDSNERKKQAKRKWIKTTSVLGEWLCVGVKQRWSWFISILIERRMKKILHKYTAWTIFVYEIRSLAGFVRSSQRSKCSHSKLSYKLNFPLYLVVPQSQQQIQCCLSCFENIHRT